MMSSLFSLQELGREAGNLADCDDLIYFAVGSDAEKSWPNLLWVARNFAEKKICFLHVLQPTKMIPSKYEPRMSEKERVHEVLNNYHRLLCDTGQKRGGDVYTKFQNIEEGILMLISRLKIKNLVMGAAASKEMVYLRSKITGYVSEMAAVSCQVWFVHGGHLIKTRYEQMNLGGSSKKETYEESRRREKAKKASMEAACKREELQLLQERKDGVIGYPSILDWSKGSSSSQSSINASFAPSAPPIVDLPHGKDESEGEDEILRQASAQTEETISNSVPPLSLSSEGPMYDELYVLLENAMAEIDKSKMEAFEESKRRREAERDAILASRRAKAAEIKMNSQLVSALGEKLLLEDEITDLKRDKKKLTEKVTLSVEQIKRYKNDRDKLKAELDRALSAAEDMKHLAESSRSSGSLPQLLTEFSHSEIRDATCDFDPSLSIDGRGHWLLYKGVLRHTEVDIKILDPESLNGPSEYRQEVEALSRLRHPNIVTLIGVCPEDLAIIYEHSPNGNLEDRLICEDDSSPLPWQTRISIAAELCSVLVFLQSINKSQCIVHGDLIPANIFLDANFKVKLGHFGLSRTVEIADLLTPVPDDNKLREILSSMVTQRAAGKGSCESSSVTSASLRRTKQPSDTFVYMDLDSVITKEYTPALDPYSFGIILLRLLTGREAWGLIEEVQDALVDGNLDCFLDCLAGDWPYVQAQQLAEIALRCTDVNWENRPDLESQVLGLLQKMKASCQGSLMGSGQCQPPPYYLCPISQDVMEDPHVAADGFTYEKEDMQGWLDSGRVTSPMTNLKLEHMKLVPNRTLRSAIQEWKQEQHC